MSEGNVSSSGDNCRVVWKSLELIQSRRTAPAWQFLTFWRGSSLERVLPFLSFQLCTLGLGQTPSRCLAIFSIGCGLCIYKYVYLYVYYTVYIYICCRVKAGPIFAFYMLKTGPFWGGFGVFENLVLPAERVYLCRKKRIFKQAKQQPKRNTSL